MEDPANEPMTLFPPNLILDYAIRESPRARTVRLNMTPQEGLVVVIPTGFNRSRIPEIVAEKSDWIERTKVWAEEQRRMLGARVPPQVPGVVEMIAIGESWLIRSQSTSSSQATVREHDCRTLRLSGPVCDTQSCLDALSRWTGRKARAHLVPWLQKLSGETGLEFEKAIIGNQQTRWASCSPKRTISLNQKLLFLPPHLVRYVLVHELCHIRQLNHSRRFWSLVERHEPSWRDHRRELGESWQLVPSWLDR